MSSPTIAFVFGFLQSIIVIKKAIIINNALSTKNKYPKQANVSGPL